MDLFPPRSPWTLADQVASALVNVAHRVVQGSIADLRPAPRTAVDQGDLREVFRYDAGDEPAERGGPVLLVSPLAAPALCYDLRRGCSLVEHLVETGRPTYLVEYGEVSFRDRDLALGPWVEEIVPAAVRAVSEDAGGRPVQLVGWSVGGILALLAAAADPSLPIASITALGTPFDVREVPLVAPARSLLEVADGFEPLNRIFHAAGGVSVPVVEWVLELSAFQRLVAKPLALAGHLDDADYLAQVEAVDRFRKATTAYRGRSFGQLYHRLLTGNTLAEGTFELATRTLSLADVEPPVLVCAGATDQIAPMTAVKIGVPLLTGSREASFEIVPGGHLGMLTGREARTATWPVLDRWLGDHDPGHPAPVSRPPTTAATRKAAQGASTKKAPAKKRPPATKTPAKKAAQQAAQAPDPEEPSAIGTNPTRRYGSGGSRALRR